jgi:hypothetical protein
MSSSLIDTRPVEQRPRAGSIVRFKSDPEGPTYYVRDVWNRHRPTRTIAAITPSRESLGDPRCKAATTYRSVALVVVRHTKPAGFPR